MERRIFLWFRSESTLTEFVSYNLPSFTADCVFQTSVNSIDSRCCSFFVGFYGFKWIVGDNIDVFLVRFRLRFHSLDSFKDSFVPLSALHVKLSDLTGTEFRAS